MAEFPNRPLLTLPQSPVPSGDTFLLPVCINYAQLNDLISRYMVGMWAEYNHENPELDIEGLQPVLEAMAFVDKPEDTECGAETPDCSDCVVYQPNVGFITYEPNDPFSTPEFIPEGYILPPWYNNPLIPLPGVVPTDAMVNFAAFPVFASLPEILASGMPRARIHFSGIGELEVEFVQVPQGGYVLVTVDGNPLNNRLYDLNAVPLGDLSIIEDIFDIVIGQNLNATVTAEFEFVTPGDHYVDVTFLPQVSTDTIVGFGGGIRRVSLCGLSEISGAGMPEMRTIDDGCTLQWRPNNSSAWITLSTELCPEDGTDGTDGIDGASPEMRVSGGYIQWRQDDNDPTWTNLISIASITGADGIDGASPEMRVSGGYIQWRQDDNNPTWANLVSLADLTGAPGMDGDCPDCEPEYVPLDPEEFPGEDLACIAAYNATDLIKQTIDDAYAAINAGAAFFAIAAAVMAVITLVVTAGAAWPIIAGVVAALIDLGGAGILLTFTSGVYDTLRCILYCHAAEGGTWDDAALALVKSDITTQIGGVGATILNLILDALGAVGLTNAGATGDNSTADCAECDCGGEPETWCYTWDFKASNGGWVNWQPAGRGAAGWVSGSGWHAASTSGGLDAISIRKAITGTVTTTEMEIEFQNAVTGANPSVRAGDYTTLLHVQAPPTTNPVDIPAISTTDGFSVYVNKADGGTAQYFTDNFITRVTIRGGGALPSGLTGGAEC